MRADPILTIGSLVAADLYGLRIPIVLVPENDWGDIPSNGLAVVEASEREGRVQFLK
jgi:hypothetical protein